MYSIVFFTVYPQINTIKIVFIEMKHNLLMYQHFMESDDSGDLGDVGDSLHLTELDSKKPYKSLTPLPPGKTRTMRSPLAPNLVRTGVVGDGSCFFHALFYALCPSYHQLTESEQCDQIRQERLKFAQSYTLEDWKSLLHGDIYRMHLTAALRNCMISLPLFQWIDADEWDDIYLPLICQSWQDTDISMLSRCILQTLQESSTHPPIPPLFASDLDRLVIELERGCHQYYCDKLAYDWVDSILIPPIRAYYQCNFIFIDMETRDLYEPPSWEFSQSVLIGWVGHEHYESIGELLANQTVRRVFSDSHPLIQRLRARTSLS
jgi:hypothetical protein